MKNVGNIQKYQINKMKEVWNIHIIIYIRRENLISNCNGKDYANFTGSVLLKLVSTRQSIFIQTRFKIGFSRWKSKCKFNQILPTKK